MKQDEKLLMDAFDNQLTSSQNLFETVRLLKHTNTALKEAVDEQTDEIERLNNWLKTKQQTINDGTEMEVELTARVEAREAEANSYRNMYNELRYETSIILSDTDNTSTHKKVLEEVSRLPKFKKWLKSVETMLADERERATKLNADKCMLLKIIQRHRKSSDWQKANEILREYQQKLIQRHKKKVKGGK